MKVGFFFLHVSSCSEDADGKRCNITMIISYPIHIPYTKAREQRVVPDTIFNNSEILSGSYPMRKNRFWHGGVHIHPNDRNVPIRAIADGEIPAYRQFSKLTAHIERLSFWEQVPGLPAPKLLWHAHPVKFIEH